MRLVQAGRALAGAGMAVFAPFSLAPSAHAQSAPPVPPQAVQQGIPTREQVTPPAPVGLPPATATVDSRSALAPATCPFEASALTLALARVRFQRPGGGALQPALARTLAGIGAPGGVQPIRVVCELRDAANAALRRDGWVASVQIPPQSIAAGELLLTVVSARITEVRVRGAPGPYRRALTGRIARLKALDPLNERDAERALLLAGDVPGLEVQLSLRPAGTEPGDVIGDLNVVYRPFAISANVENYNSRALGRETGYLRAEVYGLTGLSDLTYLGLSSTAQTREQRIVQAGHILGLDANGTTLGGRFTYAWSRPDLGALDLRTDTLIWGLDLLRPIVRSVGGNLRAGLGFDYVDQDTRVAANGTLARLNLDKLRVLFGQVTGDLSGRRADGTAGYSVRGSLELRRGLGVFGATPARYVPGAILPSRINGDSRATVIRASLDVTTRASRVFSFAGTMLGQWSNRPLLNYEEFSLGNLTIGRGYDPGANTGDRAVGARAEGRADLPALHTAAPQLFGFFDAVALTNLDANSTEVDRHLRSFGGGLRITVANLLQAEATYAHPLDRALTIDKGPPPDRVLLSLITQLRGRAR